MKKYQSVVVPMVLLGKNLGQIYVSGPHSTTRSTLEFLVPIIDKAGHPLGGRKVLVTGGVIFRLYKGRNKFRNTNMG